MSTAPQITLEQVCAWLSNQDAETLNLLTKRLVEEWMPTCGLYVVYDPLLHPDVTAVDIEIKALPKSTCSKRTLCINVMQSLISSGISAFDAYNMATIEKKVSYLRNVPTKPAQRFQHIVSSDSDYGIIATLFLPQIKP